MPLCILQHGKGEQRLFKMVGNDTARSGLKTELIQRVEALGLQQALFPADGGSIDEVVRQLEGLNFIPRPLHSDHLSALLGEWQLVYASRGTVVTRKLISMPKFGGEIKIRRIWQTLVLDDSGDIAAENGAVLDFPLLGEGRLLAQGVWAKEADEQAAKVTFSAFSIQSTQLFGQPSWRLPELKIPVLDFLRNEALWITSYLDDDLRVGRGATGNLFVFRRFKEASV